MKRYDVGLGRYEDRYGDWVKYEDALAAIEAARQEERDACIHATEQAYIEGRGTKGCIDAIRARSNK